MKHFIIALLCCLSVLMIGCAADGVNLGNRSGITTMAITMATLDRMNRGLDKLVERTNEVYLRHYGVKAIHFMYITTTEMVIDYDSKYFGLSTQSIRKQVSVAIESMDPKALEKIGVKSIKILIDHEFYDKLPLSALDLQMVRKYSHAEKEFTWQIEEYRAK